MQEDTEDIEDTDEIITSEKEKIKFTDWNNEPKVSDLKRDLSSAQSDHDYHVSKVNEWLDNLNVTGTARIKNKTGSNIVPKLIRKQAEWRYAALSEPFLSTDDLFNTDPVTFEDKQAAIQNGLVLNNQFNTKINKIKFIDEYIRTAVDEGTVVVKVGWDFIEEKSIIDVPEYTYSVSTDEVFLNKLASLLELAKSDPNKFISEVPDELKHSVKKLAETGEVLKPEISGYRKEKKYTTVKNQPTVEICNYYHVIIDPTCLGNLENANFVIYSFETSLAELRKTGKYKNLDDIEPSAATPLSIPDSRIENISFTFKDKPRQKILAYEYWGNWDINNDGIIVPIVATWVGNTLISLEENPYPDKKHPFIAIQYLPVRKLVYGEPDGELLEDNQKIIGAVTRGMIDIMGKSANGQTGSRKDALDVVNKAKFRAGEDYEFNGNIDPRQAFHMHTFPEIPRSAQYMLDTQNAEAESLTGVKAFSSGISGQALGNTATGIRSALDATSKRELGILRRLADGIKQIGRKVISMNSEFLSEEEVVRITNDEFVTVRRDDLAGNFDISLSISTPEADEQKAKELAFMLQTTAQSSDPEEVRMIRAEIARLRKMPALAKQIEDFKPQVDPIAQEKATLELELIKAQIANENAKAHENTANGDLDEARVQTELAKARNIESDSDMKDLNFVEQETGTTHERDKDKIISQAQGNMALKTIEHNFKMKEQNDKPNKSGLESV